MIKNHAAQDTILKFPSAYLGNVIALFFNGSLYLVVGLARFALRITALKRDIYARRAQALQSLLDMGNAMLAGHTFDHNFLFHLYHSFHTDNVVLFNGV